MTGACRIYMSMYLTLGELRTLIWEAVGDRTEPNDKTHLIYWVLSRAGGPLSRPAVMQRVGAVEGKDPTGFKPRSNVDYWRPSPVMKSDWERDAEGQPVFDPDGSYRRTPERMVPNTSFGAQYSVLVRGFVKVAGKKGNQLLYELTPEGQRLADEADVFLKQEIDPAELETLGRF